ncbi:HNH endonuclease [Paenibacillus cineris]|uniref:HNH nuclease domain-containing protein n=1 Tax=Paenibacillus cineris TaxID=237530 RepID=A0ABQ4LKX6_9BACL|nr:HNH endonuclease signature motif containing protein [Paenibacillus cineris]GIO56910.1 hypothetical protein J21TS7_52280 [Paenibacillus cineris]
MTIEANLRRAIWKAYHKKCFYCGEDVSWRELHIDHFIPRHLDSDLKREILSDLKLDVDFEFNSLKNLVPSHSSCNTGRKGKLVPKSINIVAGTLLITENQIPKILEIKEKLDLEEKYDENIAQMVAHIEKGYVTPEELYDHLSQDDESFVEAETIEANSARISTKNVMIYCNLPEFPEIHGSLLIAFRSLRIRDCYITFSHLEMVNKLFQGIGSCPESGFREFIVAYNATKECVVQLGNNRFTLSVDIVRQLCELIDKVAPVYINAVKAIESVFKTQNFSYSSNGRFKLLKISRSLWRNILEFAREHDYENGDTEWHIFDGRAAYLKICCEIPQDKVRDYRLFVYPEAEEREIWESFIYPDEEVWLCWEPSFLIDNKEDSVKFKNNIVWDAEYSYQWLKNRLIPVVLEYKKSKQKSFFHNLFKRRKFLMPTFETSDFTLSVISHNILTDIKNIEIMRNWIDEVQIFFATHSRHYLSVESIDGVYKAILLCLNYIKLNQGTLEYINIKLDGNGSLESIIKSVEQKLMDIRNRSSINGSNMEYTLRSLCVMLREGTIANEEKLVLELVFFLNVLGQEYAFLCDLERVRVLA